ncbi:DUF4232 domain-containing protein [Streptomyces sp. NPDC059786]|uniref:DUF4232 domain-containing protein n=1 Tax=Streptomyces sp. NPDC059786 TaxID=3346946 RepID=UPI003655A68E
MTERRNTTDQNATTHTTATATAGNGTGRRSSRAALAVTAVTAATAVAGLGLAGTATAQTSGTSAAQASPTCSASALKVTFGKKLAGGMNHHGVIITFRNLSGETCALRGYPGLGLENSAHHTLKSSTHWGPTWYAADPGKKTLTLKDGESAEALVSWTGVNTGTSDAVHASYLQITPPAATTHKTLAFPEWVDNGDLDVTALAKHIDVGE